MRPKRDLATRIGSGGIPCRARDALPRHAQGSRPGMAQSGLHDAVAGTEHSMAGCPDSTSHPYRRDRPANATTERNTTNHVV